MTSFYGYLRCPNFLCEIARNSLNHTATEIRILADAQRDREMGYRDKALKMYPHVCGRCAREFAGKRLSELTVHHRNHNHDDNPQDGSNWELLCLYCHDNEHSRYTDQQYFGEGSTSSPTIAKAYAGAVAGGGGRVARECQVVRW